jgi:DNA-binding MarR family transcriptional regulator
MYRHNREREARRVMEGVATFRGPLLPARRRDLGLPIALEPWTGFALIVAAHTIERRFAHAAYLLGISLRDFVVLAEAARVPGISNGALAERVGLGRSRMSEQLAVLEAAGYVTRELNVFDLRMRRVYPTFDGQQVVEEAAERLTELDRGWLSLLAPAERRAFTAVVRRLPAITSAGRP